MMRSAACSIGAYEPGTWYVNSDTGSNGPCRPNTPTTAFITLNVALGCAGDSDTVSLAGKNALGGVSINTSITLTGPSTGTATIIGGGPVITVASTQVGASGPPTVTFQNLTISGRQNDAVFALVTGTGGGIANFGTLTILNCDITGNSVVQDVSDPGLDFPAWGGGIYDDATLFITNSTISGNSAPADGGGIYSYSSGTNPNVTLSNTILAGNTASAGGPDCYGSSLALQDGPGGHNILGDDTNCSGLVGASAADQIGTAGSPIKPRLGALATNGGPTQTMALLPGSPAINGGSAAACAASPVNDLDQRGGPRSSATRASCDIGAYDTAAPVIAINQGWTLLTLPVGGITTTAQLVTSLTAPATSTLPSGSITLVATYANGRCVVYVPGYAASQTLQRDQGIFVLSTVVGTWIPSGTRYSAAQQVSLHPGWNLVGAPFPAGGLMAGTAAHEIDSTCSNTSACNVKEIAVYRAGDIRPISREPAGQTSRS